MNVPHYPPTNLPLIAVLPNEKNHQETQDGRLYLKKEYQSLPQTPLRRLYQGFLEAPDFYPSTNHIQFVCKLHELIGPSNDESLLPSSIYTSEFSATEILGFCEGLQEFAFVLLRENLYTGQRLLKVRIQREYDSLGTLDLAILSHENHMKTLSIHGNNPFHSQMYLVAHGVCLVLEEGRLNHLKRRRTAVTQTLQFLQEKEQEVSRMIEAVNSLQTAMALQYRCPDCVEREKKKAAEVEKDTEDEGDAEAFDRSYAGDGYQVNDETGLQNSDVHKRKGMAETQQQYTPPASDDDLGR